MSGPQRRHLRKYMWITKICLLSMIRKKPLKPDGKPKVHEKGNLLFTRNIKRGDPEKAFLDCAAVVEKTYRTSFLEHTYLEPDAGSGYVDSDGRLVIMASTQNPHYDHSEVVSLLGVDANAVRIIQAATGGGFGSKLDLNVQGFVGLALYYLRRPVVCVFSREETFRLTAKRHPLKMTLKTGADETGRLKAITARIICDTGGVWIVRAGGGFAGAGACNRTIPGGPCGCGKSLCIHQQPLFGRHEGFRGAAGRLCPRVPDGPSGRSFAYGPHGNTSGSMRLHRLPPPQQARCWIRAWASRV